MSQLRYSNYKRIFGNVETIQFSDTSLAFVSDREEQPLSTIKPLQSKKPLIEYQKATIGTYGGGRNIRLQHTPILYGHPQRDEEGGKLSTAFTPIEIPQGQPFARKSQLGGTITQHPEKQGFERGVTSAGFPTQEQMTGLGFRQGAASYKPQRYQLGVTDEGVQQEEGLPQQNVEAPPQSLEGQQIGNIEAAQEQGLSMQPKEIEEPKAKPEEQAADDIAMKVPEGSYVLNYMAVNLAGEDYIGKIINDAEKIAAKKGIKVTETESTSKDKVDIRISNGEVIIPPELVTIIGEHTLKLINDKGIAAMKKKEQLDQGPQAGQYGGAETPPPPQQANGGFIDMKKGYASGDKVKGKKKSPNEIQPWVEALENVKKSAPGLKNVNVVIREMDNTGGGNMETFPIGEGGPPDNPVPSEFLNLYKKGFNVIGINRNIENYPDKENRLRGELMHLYNKTPEGSKLRDEFWESRDPLHRGMDQRAFLNLQKGVKHPETGRPVKETREYHKWADANRKDETISTALFGPPRDMSGKTREDDWNLKLNTKQQNIINKYRNLLGLQQQVQ